MCRRIHYIYMTLIHTKLLTKSYKYAYRTTWLSILFTISLVYNCSNEDFLQDEDGVRDETVPSLEFQINPTELLWDQAEQDVPCSQKTYSNCVLSLSQNGQRSPKNSLLNHGAGVYRQRVHTLTQYVCQVLQRVMFCSMHNEWDKEKQKQRIQVENKHGRKIKTQCSSCFSPAQWPALCASLVLA